MRPLNSFEFTAQIAQGQRAYCLCIIRHTSLAQVVNIEYGSYPQACGLEEHKHPSISKSANSKLYPQVDSVSIQ